MKRVEYKIKIKRGTKREETFQCNLIKNIIWRNQSAVKTTWIYQKRKNKKDLKSNSRIKIEEAKVKDEVVFSS